VGDGAVGPDVRARGCDQFGDVGGQQEVGGRDLAEAEVDDPCLPGVVEEEVGEAEIAVGDPVPPELADEVPHCGEHRVGHVGGGDAVERPSGDRLVGEHVAVGLGAGEGAQCRRAHAERCRAQRHERLVLDAASQ
jgi:hypothetical protein